MQVLTNSGLEPLNESKINQVIQEACQDLDYVDWTEIAAKCKINWYDGISTKELAEATIMSALELIEMHPNYDYVAARLLLRKIEKEVYWPFSIAIVKSMSLLDDQLGTRFGWQTLEDAINLNYDKLFKYRGVRILYDKYLLRTKEGELLETPQYFFMRVAMGIALGDEAKDVSSNAINYYNLIASFSYMPSTPTLFNAGTKHPQLASCYVQHIPDSLDKIFEGYADQAQMSKWAGGIGTNWTSVRATGSLIEGTRGRSTGVVPWLKIQNDIAIAVDQGGKRKGAHCVYLETWHADIEDFLDLRKNIGDDRRRTHDLHTAHWIPDLFMERVKNNGQWSLFCPSQAPLLTQSWGEKFKEAYEMYELEGVAVKTLPARDLWKKMITAIFETGHPWITFKDACNRDNPLQYKGMIRSSNLCTEITLNTNDDETAVCNLGSINLESHIIINGRFNFEKLEQTTKLAIHMLDNIIDIMFYPTEKAATTNKENRPVGLGIMGWQNCLYRLNINFDSSEALELAEKIQQLINSVAKNTSRYLAEIRGVYFNWNVSNQKSPQRNSYLTAIAPTATISHITGTSPSIEPLFSNLYTESKLSGEFTIINSYLVEDLIKENLWTENIRNLIKLYNGSIQKILEIPLWIRQKYKTAFEIPQKVLVDLAAVRQPYIDQSQSLNLYVTSNSGKDLADLYMYAWEKGLKTTYYLRGQGASQVEKSTIDPNIYGTTHFQTQADEALCMLENGPDCEACQ